MKHLLWLMALCLVLASCGEYFEFEESPGAWDSVSMRVERDSAFIMEGDSMPLRVEFTPSNPNGSPVFWLSSDTALARIVNDTLVGVRTGDVQVRAVGGYGRLEDTCHVSVIEPWLMQDFSASHPHDMVVYARITVDGQPWDASACMVGAFVRGQLAGMAVPRSAFGIDYAEIRIWALATQDVGRVTFRCYVPRRYRLYVADERPEYSGTQALGTLSSLYPINFNSARK